MKSENRIHHLDSLRGVAAVMVVLHHSLLCNNEIPYHDMFSQLFGKSSVLFFFLLSGYVLSRSLSKSKNLTSIEIIGYYLRRLFRIYPAVIISLLVAALAAKFYNEETLLKFRNEWVISSMDGALSVKSFKSYCAEILLFSNHLNNPLWTIRAELVASFLLPILLITLKYLPECEIFFVFIMGVLLWLGENQKLSFYWVGYQYIFTFYLGSMLASGSTLLSKITERETKVMLTLGLLMLLMAIRRNLDNVSGSLILAAIFAPLIPCNWPALYNLLSIRPLIFLGRISFSIYLLHFPILLTTYQLFQNSDSNKNIYLKPFIASIILFGVTMMVTIPLATLSEKLVEAPFNGYGHRLSLGLYRKKLEI